jgi:hypothetical protein
LVFIKQKDTGVEKNRMCALRISNPQLLVPCLEANAMYACADCGFSDIFEYKASPGIFELLGNK